VWKSSLSSSLPTAFTIHSVFNHAVSSPPSQNNRNNYFTSTYSPPSKEYPAAEREDGCFGTEQDLEDSLEELSEGIDVLQILERAYDKTLKAHVVSGCEPFNSRVPSAPLLRADAIVSAASLSESPRTSESQGSREQKFLLEGSSTALLAVLDHPPRAKHVVSVTTPAPISASSSVIPTNSSSSTPSQINKSSSYPFSAPAVSATTINNTINTLPSSLQETRTAQTPLKASTATAPLESRSASIESFASSSGVGAAASESSAPGIECEVVEEPNKQGDYDAVMKIAHVGDCMGMLVRGEEIVWRSEEMWWSVSFNIIAYS